MKGKYFDTGWVRTLTPVTNQIDADKSDNAFGDKDIVFDWVAIDIPKGTHRIVDACIAVQGNHGARQAEVDWQLWFAKPINGVEPPSLGTPNSSVTGTGHRNHMLGVMVINSTQSASDVYAFNSFMSSGNVSSGGGDSPNTGIIVNGEKMTDTLEGFHRIYVAGLTMGNLNFSTNVLLNQVGDQAATTTTTTLTVNGAHATKVFSVGDTIQAMDLAAIGTITALTTTSITVDKCEAALENDDEILTTSPIRIKLGLEQ